MIIKDNEIIQKYWLSVLEIEWVRHVDIWLMR